jgi:hypothetical protein
MQTESQLGAMPSAFCLLLHTLRTESPSSRVYAHHCPVLYVLVRLQLHAAPSMLPPSTKISDWGLRSPFSSDFRGFYYWAACDDILPARTSCQQVERRHSRMMHQLLQLATAMLENGCNSLSGHNASWLWPAVSVAKFSRIREHAAGRYISPSGAPIPAGLSTLLS